MAPGNRVMRGALSLEKNVASIELIARLRLPCACALASCNSSWLTCKTLSL